MDFLKEILGDDLFAQVAEKINAHNGNEANKDKQIKVANLGGGEYVGKGKYDSEIEKLNNLLTGKQTELDTANSLIAELKKGTKGNEELQGKITGYESQVADLQKQLAETKLKSALKFELLSAKALDVDYVTYKIFEKMREKGQALELDDNEKIKGWDDIISDMKTQLPTHFEAAGKPKTIEVQKLPGSDDGNGGMTKADLLKKPYAERAAFAAENPDAYNAIMNH